MKQLADFVLFNLWLSAVTAASCLAFYLVASAVRYWFPLSMQPAAIALLGIPSGLVAWYVAGRWSMDQIAKLLRRKKPGT